MNQYFQNADVYSYQQYQQYQASDQQGYGQNTEMYYMQPMPLGSIIPFMYQPIMPPFFPTHAYTNSYQYPISQDMAHFAGNYGISFSFLLFLI